MKENDIQRCKGAQARERGQPLLAGPDQRGFGCCRFSGERPFSRIADRNARYGLYLTAQAVTREPTFSPEMTRRILPGWLRLKMIIGKLLSLQRLTAVVSITFKPNRRISI
jgi:hypothetical protein